MADADVSEFVEVPGDTTLWTTQGIPPRKIALPLEAHGRLRWHHPIFGIAAVWALSSSVNFYSVANQNWEAGNSLDRIGWVAGALGCLFVSLLFAGMLARALVDALSSHPLLILTSETLFDRRQLDEPMSWKNIERASLKSVRGTALVHLKLVQSVYVRNGLFRPGGALTSGLRSNVIVLISDLDKDEGDIAMVILVATKSSRTEPSQ
ncbi:hypothetical protein MPLA_1800159 [Mesorhizobium sp. ORS 3359]|nr:hypothetical protein MPLA_1800159 [Mesorhizobium sp. ORS 3359]